MVRASTSHALSSPATGKAGPQPRIRSAGVPSRVRVGWVMLALAAVTVAVYTPVWTFGFVSFDDPWYVSENANIASGLAQTAAPITKPEVGEDDGAEPEEE